MWRRKNWNRLNEMLDEGIRGEFTESRYDETELSRVEAKWKHFLEASVISKKNLESERESMKSMISDIAHQTRTPIANIRLYGELLEERLKDCGIGISEEEIPKIFQRFYRSEKVREEEGVGIGLYLAREILRKQEFAMLEAVGMTGKQLQQMLMWEGAYHALFTVALSVLAGSIISIAGLRPVGSNFFFFTWKFTVSPIILCTPVIFLVVLLVPVLGYRRLCRTSVVERIRTAE